MITHHTAYPGQPLSSREIEIVDCLANGLTNNEVGTKLGMAGTTVSSHLLRISRKLRTSNRAGIVGAAIRSGQISLAYLAPDRLRVPVVCSCRKCVRELADGRGMAARIACMWLPERSG